MSANNTEVAILGRVIEPDHNGLAPEAARFFLSLRFAEQDHARMDQLAAKARAAALTPEEQTELDEYRRVADLLALLQSKARRALRHSAGAA